MKIILIIIIYLVGIFVTGIVLNLIKDKLDDKLKDLIPMISIFSWGGLLAIIFSLLLLIIMEICNKISNYLKKYL